MMFPKDNKIRLTGKPLKDLNMAIHKRDGHCCVACGVYVDPDEKFHHEPGGKDKEDRLETGVTLCQRCHTIRHHGPTGSRAVRIICVMYLRQRYSAFWRKHYGNKYIA